MIHISKPVKRIRISIFHCFECDSLVHLINLVQVLCTFCFYITNGSLYPQGGIKMCFDAMFSFVGAEQRSLLPPCLSLPFSLFDVITLVQRENDGAYRVIFFTIQIACKYPCAKPAKKLRLEF
ncbi:hypothetical protein FKM82_029849 [Ascaphus truei]